MFGMTIATPARCFITDDGYLISNYHVVKDATKVRLLTSAGLIDAKVVQVDVANDLALLKADGRVCTAAHCRQSHGGSGRHGGDGRFSRHRFAGVRAQAGQGGSRVAVRRGGMTRAIFKSARRCSRAIRAGRWWTL